jgi:hypothetical protein
MRWALALLPLVFVLGCAKPEAVVTAAPITVSKGTAIPLMLAKQLNAGEAKEGDYVPLLVAENVIVNGSTVIPKGTLAEGEVTWSRSEGSLSGLMNQPARLEVRIKGLKLDSGSVALCALQEEPDKPYAFTRENTGKPVTDEAKVEELLKDELNRQLAEKLADLFDGKTPDMSTPDAQAALQKIAGEMGLNDTSKLLAQGQSNVGQIAGTIERLQRGDISGIAKGDLSLSLGAVMELANLAGGLGDKLSRSLKGRTIRAYPGTRLEVFVASDATVHPTTTGS